MSAVLKAIEKEKTIAVALSNFATPFENNTSTFGVYYNGKSIVSTHLLQEAELPFLKDMDREKVQYLKQIFYQNGYYLLRFQDKTVYLYHADFGLQKRDFIFEKLYAIELSKYFKGMLLSDGISTYFFAENGEIELTTLPAFRCGCYFYDRLILCNESSILFSMLGDSFQFLRKDAVDKRDASQEKTFTPSTDTVQNSIFEEGAGYIDIIDKKGSILNAIPYADKLYIVREKGIDIVTLCGVQKEFTIKSLVDTAQIAAESCCLANNGKLYFYAEDGLYQLQNQTLKKIELAIENTCVFCKEMPAVYLQNCYYLVTNTIQEREKALYAIYPKYTSVALCAKQVENIQSSGGKFFILCKDKVLTKATFGQALPTKKELFLQVLNPFATGGVLKSMQIQSLHDKTITVRSPYGVQRRFLQKNEQFMPVNLRGTSFAIYIESNAKIFDLQDLKLQFSALQGVQYDK